MPHTLLHMNGFDGSGSVADDYSGAEYFNNATYFTTFSGTVPPYNGYGRLVTSTSAWYIAPQLAGAPFTAACISGAFCFLNYGLGVSSGEQTFIQFWDGLANQVQVEIRAQFDTTTNRINLRAFRGSTLLSTASSAIPGGQNTWRWISVLVSINSTSGVVKIRVGDSNSIVMSFTGNTQNTANTRIDSIRVGQIANTGSATSVLLDDLFITSCLASDDPLTERRIRGSIFPTGNDVVAWTPSSGTNWQCVNDVPPNGDSSFNSSNTSGAQDTFSTSWPALAGNTIHAVRIIAMARKDDAGVQNLRNVIRISGTTYQGPDRTLSSTYFRYSNIWENNPATASAWTPSDFSSAMTFGYRVA